MKSVLLRIYSPHLCKYSLRKVCYCEFKSSFLQAFSLKTVLLRIYPAIKIVDGTLHYAVFCERSTLGYSLTVQAYFKWSSTRQTCTTSLPFTKHLPLLFYIDKQMFSSKWNIVTSLTVFSSTLFISFCSGKRCIPPAGMLNLKTNKTCLVGTKPN